jgi:hypothetical protein
MSPFSIDLCTHSTDGREGRTLRVLIFSRRRKKLGSCVRSESMMRSASSPYMQCRIMGRQSASVRRLSLPWWKWSWLV